MIVLTANRVDKYVDDLLCCVVGLVSVLTFRSLYC